MNWSSKNQYLKKERLINYFSFRKFKWVAKRTFLGPLENYKLWRKHLKNSGFHTAHGVLGSIPSRCLGNEPALGTIPRAQTLWDTTSCSSLRNCVVQRPFTYAGEEKGLVVVGIQKRFGRITLACVPFVSFFWLRSVQILSSLRYKTSIDLEMSILFV